jgi:hypothetical protein
MAWVTFVSYSTCILSDLKLLLDLKVTFSNPKTHMFFLDFLIVGSQLQSIVYYIWLVFNHSMRSEIWTPLYG